MYKKVRCTCKVVVLPTKSIVVLDVLVAVASSDRKVPNNRSGTRSTSNDKLERNFARVSRNLTENVFLWSFFDELAVSEKNLNRGVNQLQNKN